MNKTKSLLFIILTAVFCLSACDNKEPVPNNNENPKQEEEKPKQEEENQNKVSLNIPNFNCICPGLIFIPRHNHRK